MTLGVCALDAGAQQKPPPKPPLTEEELQLHKKDLQQQAHQETLEAFKKVEAARRGVENAKCGSAEDQKRAASELKSAEWALSLKIANEARHAPVVAAAAAEASEAAANLIAAEKIRPKNRM